MEESRVQYALTGSLILIVAYSIFFYFEYRDKMFLLFASIASIPIVNDVIREYGEGLGPTATSEIWRWVLAVSGWCLGINYVRITFNLEKDDPKLARLFTYLIRIYVVMGLSFLVYPNLLHFALPVIVAILSVAACAYTFSRSSRRGLSEPRLYVTFAATCICIATTVDWLDRFSYVHPEHYHAIFGLFIVLGLFSLSIVKVKFSRHLAKKREETRASVEQNQKMAALGEVSSSIAHEIKNPLAALLYAVDLQKNFLEKTPIDSAQLLKLNQNLEKTALQIDKIVNSLRDISRHPTADPIESVPLHRVIDLAIDLFRIRLRDSKTAFYPPKVVDGIFIECRETQICQLILNLLNNAFDAVDGATNAWIQMETKEDIDAISISVIDSGPGLDQHTREKIFKTNFTTKTKGKGTGLGLSICKGIVQQHHGKIDLVATSPQTRFEVWLPKFHTTRLT